MATNPKPKPCPRCNSIDRLAVYTYENGARHVECNGCHYLGPASGSIRWAIKLHNEKYETARALASAAEAEAAAPSAEAGRETGA